MKKTIKKLTLSRETIVNLESQEDLQRVAAGIVSSDNKACTYSAKPAVSCGTNC